MSPNAEAGGVLCHSCLAPCRLAAGVGQPTRGRVSAGNEKGCGRAGEYTGWNAFCGQEEEGRDRASSAGEGKARRNRYFVPAGTSNLQQRRGGDGARPSRRPVPFRAFRRQRPRPESCSFPDEDDERERGRRNLLAPLTPKQRIMRTNPLLPVPQSVAASGGKGTWGNRIVGHPPP